MPNELKRRNNAHESRGEQDPTMPKKRRLTPDDVGNFLEEPLNYALDPTDLVKPVDADKNSALILAVKNGHEGAFDAMMLLAARPSLLDYQNSKGVTALAVASHRGRERMSRMLLARGASVNLANHNGSTPLIQASHFGHEEIVDVLLRYNALVDTPNHKGTTALMRASQEGKMGVVERLLARRCDVNARNEDGMNALMLASQRGHANIVDTLIRSQASIDGRTVQGSTALMLACKRGHFAVVKTLLASGAELTVKDSKGRMAWDQATRRGQDKILQLLRSEAQVCLMQRRLRSKRTWLLVKLFYLLQSQRASFRQGVVSLSEPFRFLKLASEHLPFGLYRQVCEYLPLPRMWRSELDRQVRRIRLYQSYDAAVRSSFAIIDEIFTDWQPRALQRCKLADSGWLVKISRNLHVQDCLRQSPRPLPEALLSALLTEQDLQSVLLRKREGISCDAGVSKSIVALARALHDWFLWQESPSLYPGVVGSLDAQFTPRSCSDSGADSLPGRRQQGMDSESADESDS